MGREAVGLGGGPNSTIPFHVDVGIRKLNNEKTMAYEEAIK